MAQDLLQYLHNEYEKPLTRPAKLSECKTAFNCVPTLCWNIMGSTKGLSMLSSKKHIFEGAGVMNPTGPIHPRSEKWLQEVQGNIGETWTWLAVIASGGFSQLSPFFDWTNEPETFRIPLIEDRSCSAPWGLMQLSPPPVPSVPTSLDVDSLQSNQIWKQRSRKEVFLGGRLHQASYDGYHKHH